MYQNQIPDLIILYCKVIRDQPEFHIWKEVHHSKNKYCLITHKKGVLERLCLAEPLGMFLISLARARFKLLTISKPPSSKDHLANSSDSSLKFVFEISSNVLKSVDFQAIYKIILSKLYPYPLYEIRTTSTKPVLDTSR